MHRRHRNRIQQKQQTRLKKMMTTNNLPMLLFIFAILLIITLIATTSSASSSGVFSAEQEENGLDAAAINGADHREAFSEAAAAAAGDEEVILVSLTHRHGARTPILADPKLAEEICGAPGCGQLTHNGKMMLEALGNFVHDRYALNKNTGSDGTSYFTAKTKKESIVKAHSHFSAFADKKYHMRQLHSRSTQVDRTIQSADSAIRGIVRDPEQATFPVVHTVAVARDTLILTDTALSMTIPFEKKKNKCLNDIDTATFKDRFPGLVPAKLAAISEQMKMAKHLPCAQLKEAGGSSIYEWMNCTLNMQDATASFMSMYTPEEMAGRYPLALAAFDELSAFLQMIRVCKYATTSREQGALSYLLVEKETKDMEEYARGWVETDAGAKGPVFGDNHTTIMFHYSGHDTTIAPLAVALGHGDLLLPLFGQTIITELIYSKSKAAASSDPAKKDAFSLRHWYGSPKNLKPPADGSDGNTTHYQYRFEQLSVMCKNSSSSAASFQAKNVSDGSCTLDAFASYVDTVLKPTKPAGAACYLDKDLLKDISCDTAPAPAPDTWCHYYRSACPHYACPDHFAVDPKNLACIPLRFLSSVSTGQAWALACTNGAVGVLTGLAMAFIVKALRVPESTD